MSSVVKLGSQVDLIMGQAPPGIACNKEGNGVIFVKAGEFQNRHPVIREWTTKPLKLSKVNDVLVCVVGATAGKVNQSAFDCAIGRSVAAVRADTRTLDPAYLFHFLKTKVIQLRNVAQGAAQGVITREMIQSLPIYLLPLPEQHRIAAILDQTDALRAKRREALAQLDSLAQSIFIDMFGDPVTNPKGWEVKPFDSQIESVRYGTGSPPTYSEEGFPFIRATNIKSGMVSTKDLKFISHDDAIKLDRCKVHYGNLIVVRSGVNTGDCAMIPHEYDGAYAAFDLIVDIEPINGNFYSFLINSAYGQLVLAPLTRRAAQPHLNAEQLKTLEFIAPPLHMKEEFANCVSSINNLKEVHRASLTELDALFASLQHRAFRGDR